MDGASRSTSGVDWIELTSAQLPIWLDLQSGTDARSYIIGGYLRISGAIDPTVFRRAVALAMGRNDALRLRFHANDPRQCFDVDLTPPVDVVDLSHAADADAAFLSLVDGVFTRSFDVENRPLFHFTLAKAQDRRWFLLIRYHHLMIDGLGISLMIRGVAEAYNGIVRGDAGDEISLFSYRRFVAEDAAYRLSPRHGRDIAYWLERFRGLPEPIFPLRRLDNPHDGHAPAISVKRWVDWSRYQRFLETCRERGATPFHVLVVLVSALLARTMRRDDITIGVPILNRPTAEFKRTIGMFAGMMPLRLAIDDAASVKVLVERVGEQLRRDYRHQRAPIHDIHHALGLARAGRRQLFDVALSYEKNDYDFPIGDARFQLIGLTGGHELNPLALYVREYHREKPVLFEFAFNARHLTRPEVEELSRRFELLFEAYFEGDSTRIDALPLLSGEERHAVVEDWNATAVAIPAATLPALIAAQVARTPDAIAVWFAGSEVSYRELDARSNRLARRLIGLGVGPETVVGLCLERSVDLVVSMLGVLKAGGCYLPLEPSHPAARLSVMLGDAGAALVLTTRGLSARLPAVAALRLDDASELAQQTSLSSAAVSDGERRGSLLAEHLAYVIYTSGSTGTPKGVGVSHRAIVNHTLWLNRRYELGPDDRVLQKTSIGFDASVWEFLSPLAAGARVVLATPERHGDAAYLAQTIVTQGVTVVQLVPSLLPLLLDQAELGRARSLRLVFCGGEALPGAVVERFRARRLGAELHNLYGPTEATIDATSWPCAEVEAGETAPLGRPISNTRIYLLDGRLEPVPPGVIGEIYLGGVGLARGYVGRSDLTAERFVADPFVGGGGRLYRTGDLGRWRGEGVVEFVGRTDGQVKLRGVRIEPGEIEAALLSHGEVGAAAVVVRDERLVAYVVGRSVSSSALREHVGLRLPGHMVPTSYVWLEALPRTSSGKLDRAALPQPVWEAEAYAPPQGAVEELLAGLWGELLGVERVGRHDNFFALGGDSILSIQLVARARAGGLELTPREIFHQPTLATLADAARVRAVAPDHGAADATPTPLTPIQHWFVAQRGPLRHFNQAILLQTPPKIDAARLDQALAHVVAHHGTLRLRVFRAGAAWRQVIEPPDELNRDAGLVQIDLAGADPATRLSSLEEESARLQAALDPVRGPVWKAAWFDFGDSPGRLLLAIHHLAVDAVSWRILVEDIVTAYEQLDEGQVLLPARTTGFQTWAHLLAREAHAPATLADLPYWQGICAGATELPRDRAAPAANRAADADRLTVELDAATTQQLLREAPRAYRTQINDVLLAALGLAIARWQARYHEGAPSSGLVIDLEGHGREESSGTVDLSRSVGWFTTIFPVRLDWACIDIEAAIAGSAAAGIALKRMKERLRAVPHKGLGFGLLSQLNSDTAPLLAAFPARELAFNYLGQFDQMARGDWRLAEESPGPMVAATRTRPYLVEANALVKSGALRIEWSWCRDVHDRAAIAALAEDFLAALRGLVGHCLTPGVGGHTPSDFPLARLSQDDVEALEQRYPDLETAFPLSPLQHGLLFHALYDGDADPYRVQLRLDIDGSLEAKTLRRAWQYLLKRHEALRVAVLERESLPLQIVRRSLTLPWREEDWSALGDAAFASRLAAFLGADRAQGFDFATGPLLRVALLRRAATRWVMTITNHHLLFDGWSLSVLLDELLAVYGRLQGGRPPLLTASRPYGEYLAWLSRQDQPAARVYWRQRLAGAVPLSDLLPRPARADHGMGERRLTLAPERSALLRAFVRRHGLTLGTVIHGAWALVLARCTGQADVVFGTTVAGRPGELAGIERMVGLFISTLPLRARVEERASVVDWLRSLHSAQLEDQRHFHASLAEIQGEADSFGGGELFQTLVVVENYPLDAALQNGSATGAGFRVVATSAIERTHYPVTLIALPRDPLDFHLSFDRAQVDEADGVRLLGHFDQVLHGMVSSPGLPVSSLGLLSGEERREITEGWNGPSVAVPWAPLPELFAAQVARTPAAVAVSHAGALVTYRDLDARSNRLARRLIGLGVGPETVVGLCLDRSVEFVVAVLGVLKAGGCYLPLDPGYPSTRLSVMLGDAGALLVLTTRALSARLPAVAWLHLDDASELAQQALLSPAAVSDGERRGSLLAEHLAYVIYTSGSTGTPKGVAVSHRSLTNKVATLGSRFGVGPGFGYALLANPVFDPSVEQIAVPLAHGGRVVIVDDGAQSTASSFWSAIAGEGVQLLNCVPAFLATMIDGAPSGLRLDHLVLGGEAFPASLLGRIRARLDVGTITNFYGPTEATVDATGHIAAAEEPGQWLPIGSPLPNYRVYVLDERLEPVPVGVIGEIYLGGVGLARGYVGRSDLTAERFVADPFVGGGGRLYRTGDLGRWRGEGVVEFVGRADGQVKLRGVRIEPGEIEAALLSQGSVSAAAVVVRDDRLVAYVVGRSVSSSALRAHLGLRLPGSMIPGSYVWLEALPRTSSGKLDRSALPAPARVGESYAAPQGAVEELLAGLWSELLGVERIGRHDNFFELGGHSLLATRVVSRLRVVLGVEVALRSLFEAPTVAGLAAVVSGASATSEAPLVAGSRPAVLPLSYAQQRLWFMEQLEGGASYTVPLALRLAGPLDVAALRSALSGVVERHEALRTCFPVVAGSAVQSILPAQEFALTEEDLSDEADLGPRLAALSRQRFDLSRDLPIAASLIRLGPEDHVLAVVVHHIAFDGWSSSLLLQEVSALYRSAVSGGDGSLPALAVQYADYALWQRDHGAGSRDLAYWKDALAGAPEALSLPTDHPRPSVRRGRGGVVALQLDGSLVARLRVLSRREGVTLFMVLQAALAVVLGRWSGQEDVLVGTPVANRTRQELEGLIGFFVNTLVLRTRLDGDPTTRELLGRVRETAVGAYSHQDLPFEQLVEALQPVRRLDRSPLFQVMLVLQNAPAAAPALAGVQALVLPLASGTSKYDLTLSLMETEAGLEGDLEYDADLFASATAARLLDHLALILRGMASSPAARVSSLPLLSAEDRREITHAWNATAAAIPAATLPALFAAQVARTPDAIAVWFAGSEVSYRELDARSNRLARRLIGLGVGPETVVGLCLERSVDLVVSMLGVLKAGGCYLPLEPSHPAARLSVMLGDAGAALVLTTRGLSARLPAVAALRLDDASELAQQTSLSSAAVSDGERRGSLLAEHLAYVIYTSGSTGTPKGVGVSHRAIVNHTLWLNRRYELGPDDRVLQKTSIGFDASVWEFLSPLAAGARVVLATPERHGDAAYLAQTIVTQGVTVVQLVPSLLPLLLDQAELGRARSLRLVFCGGEALPGAVVERFRARRLGAELHNLYGPTEATIDATSWPCAEVEAGETAPLGRPISNTRIYLLDGRLEPVPPGVIGEIYLGGVGLARGYVGRSDLTAERFVADPFVGGGGRLYRTGDLGRWRGEGVVEFVGRTDGQVKLRGVRIEPGEIEAALLSHGEVGAAAVVVRDERLVAYVVGRSVSSSALREHVGLRLPGHMVPTSYVWLEALPRTSSGKLDRAALPQPVWEAEAYAPPQGAVEELLAGLWGELLGVERVGRHDNFFELGGHSLLATRLVSRLRGAFGVELPVRALFEAPTVAGLAGLVSGASPTSDQPIRAKERPAALPLSYAQQRLWFLEQLDGGTSYTVPMALRLEGPLDVAALRVALAGVVERHEALRTCFPVADGIAVQSIRPAGAFVLLEEELSDETELSARLECLAQHRFDLSRDLLVAATLLRLGPEDHVLAAVVHHIAFDGWSAGIFLQELSALYGAASAGFDTGLPPLRLQYADFALWQRDHIARSRDLDYWKEALTGAPEALSLPTDRARTGRHRQRGATLTARIDGELGRSLRVLARRESVTLFMILHAALSVVLSRWSGQDDVLIGTPVANRTRQELEDLIGFFVNTLVLRTRLDSEPSSSELLARVRESALGAYAHQDLPFEQLVEALQAARSLHRSPLFQVMLALQNVPEAVPGLPGLRTTPLPIASGAAKFDLTLSVTETADGGLASELQYDADLFEASTASRLLDHLERVLRGMVSSPGLPVSSLGLLSGEERREITEGWNGPSVAVPWAPLPELFAAQVARTPAAVAVSHAGALVTYRDLDARSNRLARRLIGLGVGPETVVGLCLDRSVEFVVAVLGVLKAGGCYLPLDPGYPSTRLSVMLGDAGALLVLTTRALSARLPAVAWLHLDDASELAQQALLSPAAVSDGERRGSLLAEHLAYVIYTSGSTGTPKGVAVSHRSLTNKVATLGSRFGVGPGFGYALLANPVFDPSVEQIAVPLAHGGRVVIVDDGAQSTASSFWSAIAGEGVQLLNCVPAFLATMIDGAPSGLRLDHLVLGGEAFPASLLGRIRARLDVGTITNFYGPTEATVDATGHIAAAEEPGQWLPIGSPLPNYRVYVLDERLEPVPVGVIGEIYLGGVGLARGYVGRSDLTAERFVADPFVGGGGRLYRTGDLGRWRGEGVVEFVGRADGQVKLRGVRIEPGEIEAALLSQGSVSAAAVVVRDDRLVAYVVGRSVSSSALRAHLGLRLPGSMIPGSYVWLEALPRTSSGKLDRSALPAPARVGESYAAPQGAVEELLAGLWSELLGVERIGRHDNFFELGGHSLLATRVVSRLRVVLGVEVALRSLFEAPTVAGLAAVVSGASSSAGPALVAGERPAVLPLSYAQQRLWFMEQLEGGTSYAVPLALRLEGALDVAALGRALAAVVERHEALRTCFPVVAGSAVQSILPASGFALAEEDVTAATLPSRLEQLSRHRFDLSRDLPLVARLLRLGAAEHVLAVVVHHIAFDGWSSSLLLDEVSRLYRGEALSALSVQYADYALWQRSQASGSEELAYWREALAGAPEALSLPTDHARPAQRRGRGGVVSRELDGGVVGALRGLARREGVTLFMVVQAALAVVLGRWSGQDDILIGTPVANRTRQEVEGLIGFFVNTLVLRTRLAGDPSVSALLSRVRETALGAYAHQALPFEHVVEGLQPVRRLDRSPLFQVMLVLQNAASPAALPGVRMTALALASQSSKYDLTLSLAETGEGLSSVLEYDADLFEAATASRLLGHVERVLRAMAADPEAPISRLVLLSDAERRAITEDWNATAAPLPAAPLPELFAAQAARTPAAVAVSFAGSELSYAELDARSNRLARRLIGLGVGPETVVGVALDRSLDLVVAILGVVKAGGCYLSLETSHPAARLSLLLADAGAALVLTTEALAALLPAAVPALHLDAADEPAFSAAAVSDGERRAPLLAEHLAYIIYTSGSTGTPKGVAVSHRSLVNLALAHIRDCEIGVGARVLQHASPVFDVSVAELWMTLLSGASLVLAPAERLLPGEALGRLLAEEQISHVMLVASILASLPETALAQCRMLVVGGEPCAPELVKRWSSGRRMVNAYGPAEATVCATMSAPLADAVAPPPLGRPLPNTRVYVLDERLEPVPVGVIGEIYLGGVGLARGYVGRSDLTAERFVADPFVGGGGRLYRTGDLGRWRGEGVVEFVGRADGQVKLRGVRIEPGEIEAALLSQGSVSAAAVVVRDDRLVAYVVGRSVSSSALRAHLGLRLPGSMIPGSYVWLEALPRTSSGKLDRSALPAPARVGESYAAPQGAVEELLAGLWSELLGVERIGRHDNFFELGGHSLLATRVVSRLRVVLGVEVALRSLFEAPTVAGLAAVVSGASSSAGPALVAGERPAVLPLSYAQQRLWFMEQLEGGTSYAVPLALRLEGALDVAALGRALAAVVERHEALRTCFPVVAGSAVQSILPASGFALAEEDVTAATLPSRLEQLSRHRFDLSRDLPLVARLLRLGAAEHVLAVVVHHIAFDGWSSSLLLDEVSRLYRGEALSALSVQYADYALWQRSQASGSEELAYWREALAGAPEALSLPTDHARPAQRRGRGGVVSRELDGGVVGALRGLARREGVTLFMVVQAALAVVLGRWSGQDDILIGTPVANRTRQEVEGLIGFFVNTLVLRTRLAGDPSVSALLSRVRETALGAYAHQALPFEHVVEGLQPVRRLDRSPLFQVMLVLQNAASPAALPGVRMTALALASQSSKYDLTLSLAETGEGLSSVLEYDADLFEAATASRLLGHVERVLRAMAADPEAPISRLVLLSDAERRAITEDWNATAAPLPAAPLPELFAAQAARTPAAVAVSFAGSELSYAELDARSNRLARRLIGLGVGPETVVGVALDRSLDLVVAILGVVKAGGCYLSLETSHPAARLSLLLADAGAALVLTTEALAALLPAAVPALHLDAADEPAFSAAAVSDGERRAPLLAEHLAYIIYTSGSTGTPKGVAVSHRSLVNLALAHIRDCEIGVGARVLQHASPVFDVSVAELWMTLLSGASLVLAPAERLLPGEALGRLLAEEQISHVMLVASILASLPETALAQCRMLVVGGEPCAPELVKRWSSGRRMVNAYGPAEATVCATMSAPLADAVAPPPLGRPLPNTRVYVLDERLEPVPVGVIGEIYLGGVGLARGYVGRSDLTAERFVADPFVGGGGRLYRTGDLGRWRGEGVVEFVGRADGQVKLRGVRIEPGEIEAALLSQGSVSAAAVVVRDDRLVAYVVGRSVSSSALRAHLGLRLPGSMIPGSYVWLEALPRTSSGKLDRSALPAPARVGESYAAPQGAVEELLAGLWSELLGVERIGRHDNFFELGGHSLLAVQFVHRFGKTSGTNLPLRRLFEQPTVALLASALGHGERGRFSHLVPIQQGSERPALFCIHPAGGAVFCYLPVAAELGRDQMVYGLQAKGLERGEAPARSVEEMASDYVAEIRAVQPTGPYHLLGWSFGGLIAYEIACRLQAEGQEVALLALLDTALWQPDADIDAITDASIIETLIDVLGLEKIIPGASLTINDLDSFVDAARHSGVWPADFSVTEAARIVELFKINVRQSYAYVPQRYRGRVVLFRAMQNPGDNDRYFDWSDKVAGELSVVPLSCTHNHVPFGPNAADIATVLRPLLQAGRRL